MSQAVSYTHLDHQKFLSLFAVLPGALQSFWPSLHPLDLLVGLCCGAGLRLAVYLKSKNAKKYRCLLYTSRETVLRQYLDTLKGQYSHILIDCQPSLGMLTVNALAAANRVIIPVQAEYLPAKGLEQLLQTINKVRRQINPKLQIDGILLTMVDSRTNFAKEISALLRETYGSKIKVFTSEIPHSVRAKEISAEGKSIYAHDPNGKVAEGYKNLTEEILKLEKQREKNRAGLSR